MSDPKKRCHKSPQRVDDDTGPTIEALRVLLGVVEVDEVARLSAELEALRRRVGDGAPDRALREDDLVDLVASRDDTRGRPHRFKVRQLPPALRTLCEWLAEQATHTGHRVHLYDLDGDGVDVDRVSDIEGIDSVLCNEIARVAGIEVRKNSGEDPCWSDMEADDHDATLLIDDLTLSAVVRNFVHLTVFGLENNMRCPVEGGWWSEPSGGDPPYKIVDFVRQRVDKALDEFGTGPLLHAMRAQTGDTPLTIVDVAVATRDVLRTIDRACEEAEAIMNGDDPPAPSLDEHIFDDGDEDMMCAPRLVLSTGPVDVFKGDPFSRTMYHIRGFE